MGDKIMRNGNKDILKGDYQHLSFVASHLKRNGIAAMVRNCRSGLFGHYAVLSVDQKQADVALVVGMAYVKECNRMQTRQLVVEEIKEVEAEDESESLLG